ncbi:hypothetical protein AB0F96_05390 [Streptomyces sp. NPDC023998]|uniref:hypothetical protein n=1 Tax=Streptomyces sp. NPDC023998 TaxID=3154597 RepID=UPI0033ECCE1A
MHQLTLLKLTLTFVLVPYASLGVLWVMRRVRDRRAVARIAAFDLDPYYAYAVATGHTPERPAAAALLLDGLIVLNNKGVVRLTAVGRDLERTPPHPVPARLLEAIRQHGTPATLGHINRETVQVPPSNSFYRVYKDGLPRWVRRQHRQEVPSCLGALFMIFAAGSGGFLMASLGEVSPHGFLGWTAVLLAPLSIVLLIALPNAWRVLRPAPARTDRLGDRCRSLTHPALVALDPRRTELMDRSFADREARQARGRSLLRLLAGLFRKIRKTGLTVRISDLARHWPARPDRT